MNEKISNEQMAEYMDMVLNSPEMKELYISLGKSRDISTIFMNLGNYISKYYISTGDNSMRSAVELMEQYAAYKNDEQFVDNCLTKKVEHKVAEQLGKGEDLSLSDRVEIANEVANRNRENYFYTHCFPGAIAEEVRQNGLDISKELFKEEFEYLEKFQSFRTAYKKGELNYCNLSAASLSYASKGVPERVMMTIGSSVREDKGLPLNEERKNALERNIASQLERGNISESEAEKIRECCTRMIDFYCVSKSGIAFFRKDSITNQDKTSKQRKSNLNNRVMSMMSTLEDALRDTFAGDFLKTEIDKANQDVENATQIFENALNEVSGMYPDFSSFFNAYVDESINDIMKKYAISNLEHGGFADGFSLEGGKLAPNEIGIIEITSPNEIPALIERGQYRFEVASLNIPESPANLVEHIDTKGLTSHPTISQYKKYDKDLKKISSQVHTPDSIEEFSITSKKGKLAKFLVEENEGKKQPIDLPIIGEKEGVRIYSTFTGNVESRIKSDMEFEFEDLDEAEQNRIIKEYKLENPDFDEDYLSDDAASWYAENEYNKLDEDTKIAKKNKVLTSFPCFAIYPENGVDKVAEIKDGHLGDVVNSETVYSRTKDAKLNALYNQMLDENMPFAGFHKSIYETDICKNAMTECEGKSPEEAQKIKNLIDSADNIYKKSLDGKSEELAKLVSSNPRAMSLLKFLAEKEEENNSSSKKTFLSASIKTCDEARRDFSKSKEENEK